jgi:hypothetical protein
MAENKPRVFIASSVEGLDLAYAVQENLEHSVEVTVWTQGIFGLSEYALTDLVKGIDKFDFAIFIFSFDDVSKIRNKEVRTNRDNVVFELGLFIGGIGRERCFIITPSNTENLHLPTDLLGIQPAKYDPNRSDNNLLAALGTACNQIRRLITEYGLKRQEISLNSDLIQQISNAGISAFYQSRDDYGKYRKDASSIDRYVSVAQDSIHIVSINLMTGLPFDGLCDTFREKLEGENSSFSIFVSLLNPWNLNLMIALSAVLDNTPEKLSRSIIETLNNLMNLKESISRDAAKRFAIRVHDSIPFGSAIMLDVFGSEGRIQIETKSYKAPVRKSFAFELMNNEKSMIFSTLRDGYCKLIDEARDFETLPDFLETRGK